MLKKIPHRTTCTLHPSWSSNSLGSPVNIREHGTTLRTTWKERPYHIILLHLCPYWSVSDSGFISCVNKWYFLFHWTLILDIYKAESRFFKSVFICYNVVESVFICFDVFHSVFICCEFSTTVKAKRYFILPFLVGRENKTRFSQDFFIFKIIGNRKKERRARK